MAKPDLRADLRQRLIDKGITSERADELLDLADKEAKRIDTATNTATKAKARKSPRQKSDRLKQ